MSKFIQRYNWSLKKLNLFAVLLWILLLIVSPLFSNNDLIIVSPDKLKINITSKLSYLEDKENKIEFEEIIGPANNKKFQRANMDTIQHGFTSSAYWYKFRMIYEDRNDDALFEISWPHIDYLDIYILHDNQRTIYKSGRLIPYHKRDFEHKNFIFKIPNTKKGEIHVYFRIKSDDAIMFSATLYDEMNFNQKDRREEFVLGLYYGVLLVMFFYNLFLYLSLKDKNYLIYIGYVVCLGLSQLSINGLIFQFWPGYPEWNKLFNPLSMIVLQFVLFVLFKNLLNINPLNKIDYYIINILPLFPLASSILLLTVDYSNYIVQLNILFLIYQIIPIIISFRAVLRKDRIAIFFLMTWILFLTGGVLLALRNFKILPANFFTNYSYQIGSSLEMVLLALALADKINSMKIELQKMNIGLEMRVQERTEELSLVLKQLQEKNEIVESELVIACEIQKCIMPSNTIQMNDLDILIYCEYLTKVGGDYYDIFPMANNKVGILIADVAGHGVPAALITTMAKISFMNASRKFHSTAEIFKQVNKDISEFISTLNYITAFMIILSPDGSFQYSSAGHRSALLYRKKTSQLEVLSVSGIFLGLIPDLDKKYDQKYNHIYPGDKIILYTDGILDALNQNEDRWGEENFFHTLDKYMHLDLKSAMDNILSEWRAFMEGGEFSDDSTIMLVEYKGNDSETDIKSIKNTL